MSDELDDECIAELIGKHVLVGITYLDADGQPIERRQLHGCIVRVSASEGVVLALHPSGEEYKLPPDLGALQPAEPGEYQLCGTGEVVVDPDYTCTWRISRPLH